MTADRKARIPKGTRITGTFKEGSKVQGATRVINVYAIDRYTTGDKVCWVGAGGYWHYANLADVALLGGDD